MAVIGKFPKGLVGLTELRDMGESPRELAQIIAPTIDVTQFLLTDREVVTDSNTIAGAGSTVMPNLQVPKGELWRVHGASMTSAGSGGSPAYKGTIFYREQNVTIALAPAISTLATEGSIVSSPPGQMFWAVPGAEFGFLCTAFSANFTVSAGIIITRIRI